MAREKIEIERIENSTNRQVTYSKRRNGIFKKASELTVLCDAKVSIIMLSSTGKLHEYVSPSTTTKQIFDQYQNTLGADLWIYHYERMQENLKKLKDVNKNLRKEIRQRMDEHLSICVEYITYKFIHDNSYDLMAKFDPNFDPTTSLTKKKNPINTHNSFHFIHKILILFYFSKFLFFLSLLKFLNLENLAVKRINSKSRLIKACFTFHKIYFYYA
ncbi:hypothetical protein PVL29_024983 [Vitis rotundifolia]|uniref:MADS-box domain-containing protein n=1 Tax=Vitis rotundifolia TaxID=103349 RepID=A0AA38YT78_VITRO|nr:hypothetical protein PVL29_024983 [Vitis rotundifolia]